MSNDDRLIALAAYSHGAWAEWMQYMFRQGTLNADGTWTMPAEKVVRWQRQAATDFVDMPPNETPSDYEQAGKIAALLAATPDTNDALTVAYAGRNQAALLCAALALVAGGGAGWAVDDAAPEFPVLLVTLPDGAQVSWHIPAQEATQFDIGPFDGEWDGHSTSEKQKRIAQFLNDTADAQVPRMRDE